MEKGIEDIRSGEVASYTMYNPESVVVVGAYKNCFVQPVCVFKDQDKKDYIVICLTVKGNIMLREVCHTINQYTI